MMGELFFVSLEYHLDNHQQLDYCCNFYVLFSIHLLVFLSIFVMFLVHCPGLEYYSKSFCSPIITDCCDSSVVFNIKQYRSDTSLGEIILTKPFQPKTHLKNVGLTQALMLTMKYSASIALVSILYPKTSINAFITI